MSYRISYMMRVEYIADGAGPMSVPAQQILLEGQISMQGLTVANPTITNSGQPTGYQQVPGGNSPTQANFNNAMTGSDSTPSGGMALDLATAIATNLTRIQGFASGGG